MGKVSAGLLIGIVSGLSAGTAVVFLLGWGNPTQGQKSLLDPSRADYVDLLLTVATILLGAVGLAVTVAALVIGFVALKTLREIKDDAANEAKKAAANKITEIMENDLTPKVTEKVKEILPISLRTELLDEKTRQEIITELVRTGALDEPVERAMERISFGGPVRDPADAVEEGDQGPN